MEPGSMHFDAIYENGVLRPLNPVDLPEHERLSVVVAEVAEVTGLSVQRVRSLKKSNG